MFAFITPTFTKFGSSLSGSAVSVRCRPSTAAVTMKLSQAMPFMNRPEVLDDDSIVGNVGFDPLNLSTTFNLKFMQEAEIKHCRVAMLACLGLIVPEFYKLPWSGPTDPKLAHDYFVQAGGMSQILLFISFFEVFGALALRETLEGDRAPGYYGFDPLGLGKNPDVFKKYQLSEIKNGRLAMCAFGGMYHSMLLSKEGIVEQLTHFKGIPAHLY